MKTQSFPLNIITLSLLSVSAGAWAADGGPFAVAPLHLQDAATVRTLTHTKTWDETKQETICRTTTTTTARGVKPNVMLFLDDSGSMGSRISHSATRMGVLKRVMDNVVAKNADKVNWGLEWLNRTSGNRPIGTSSSNIRTSIRNQRESGMTPTMRRFIPVAENLAKAIQYRCQKNYLIFMSDGDANMDDSPGLYYFRDKYAFGAGDSWIYRSNELTKSDFWFELMGRQYGYEEEYGPIHKTMVRIAPTGTAVALRNGNKFVSAGYPGIADAYWFRSSNHSYQCLSPQSLPNNFLGKDFVRWPSSCYYISKAGYYIPYGESYLSHEAGNMLRYLTRPLDTQDLKRGGTDGFGKSWDDPAHKNQHITTFTIGFGGGVSTAGTNFLKHGATPNIVDGDGNAVAGYYDAAHEAQLQAAFDKIFATISSQNQVPEDGKPVTTTAQNNVTDSPIPNPGSLSQALSHAISYATTAPGGIGTGASKGIPNMAASVYLPSGLRSSQLRFYKLGADGSPLKKDGNFVFTLPSFTDRKALINNGQNVEWANTQSSTVLNNAFFKLGPDGEGRINEWSQALLPWVSRYTNQTDTEIRNLNYPTPYRARAAEERDMGDVLDTPIIPIGDKHIGDRQEFLLTAANDGMVYLFQSIKDSAVDSPYALRLNYSPAAMPRQNAQDTIATKFKDIADENYTAATTHPHLFLINGGIVVRRTDDGRAQQIFMLGNMGQGARGMYAINVGGKDIVTGQALALSNTNTAKWKDEVPLFEARGTTYANLGYTVGSPQIGRLGVQYSGGKLANGLTSGIRQAGFLGSGFAYPDVKKQETALYIFDALGKDVGVGQSGSGMNVGTPGTLLTKVTVPGGEGGLATPTIVDINNDGVVDYAFAGDYAGNMYRFDLRTYPNIAVTKIYAGSGWDGDGLPRQPITAAPAVSKRGDGRYVVIFGTGSDIYDADFSAKKPQTIYGVYQRFDQDMNAVNPVNEKASANNTVSASDLLEQSLSVHEYGGNKYRQVTNADIFKDGQLAYPGWRVTLNTTDGERVVVKPEMVLGTAVLTTRIYTATAAGGNYPDWDEKNPLANGWTQRSQETTAPGCNLPEWSGISPVPVNPGDPNEVCKSAGSSSGGGSAGDLCSGSTSSATQKLMRSCTYPYKQVTTYEQIVPGKTNSSGWILTLNATNGGQLSTGVKGGTKQDAGVDFLRQFDPLYSGDKPEIFLTGILMGGTPNMALFTGNKLETPVTPDGDSGSSGTEEILGKLTVQETDCFTHSVNKLLSGDATKGLGESYSVIGKACEKLKGTYRRLSWREIF